MVSLCWNTVQFVETIRNDFLLCASLHLQIMMPGIFVRYAATSVDLADTAEEDNIIRELLKVLLVDWKSDFSK